MPLVSDAITRIALASCDSVGDGARIDGSAFVSNLGRITIGEGFHLSGMPVRSHLATTREGVLEIGRNVRIAHGASIFAGGHVIIEDDVAFGPLVMIMDTDFHEVKNRDARGTARPIRIGRGARLGAGVIVLRGAVIGEGARIAANAVVSRFVPAHARASGVPARPA